MTRYARTYGSKKYPENINEAWQYPTGPEPDNFGVPVPENNKTFGLEEFNFNPFFLDSKIAYVPCFGTERFYPRPYLKKLHLMFLLEGRHHIHYATLHGVTQLVNEDLTHLRQQIEPMMDNIYFGINTQNFFGNDFIQFTKIINQMKDSNVIASNHNHSPFLVNVRYERIEILIKPVHCEAFGGFVAQWKGNVRIING